MLRELKLRGRVKRILVVAPKGLVRQWQAEMRLHFGEKFQFIEPSELAAFRQWRSGGAGEEENLWRVHDQVICSLDSVKPLEGRRGWSLEQLNTYNRERFEDLISASWDLVIIDEAHRMGGSTEQVARYKLGAALAEASPYLLLLSATPHQGKTDQFMRLMQLLDREAFPDESSVSRDRVRPFVIRTEKRVSINAEGQPLFKPRVTRLQAVAWQARHGAQQRLYEAVTDYVRHGYNQAMVAKQRHIGFLMILMQRLVRLNAPVFDNQHMGAVFVQLRQDVAGHKNAHAVGFELQQQARKLVPRFGVQTTGGFVQQQELRTVDNHLPDADTLLLPARQGAHFAVQLVFQAEQPCGFGDDGRKSRICHAACLSGIGKALHHGKPFGQAEKIGQIAQLGVTCAQVVKKRHAVQQYAPELRAFQSCQTAHQCGFARAV